MPKSVKAAPERKAAGGRRRVTRASGDQPIKTGLEAPFEIADFSQIAGVPCPCGSSRRAFMRSDNRLVSVHVVDISKDAQAHYHKRQTETYYFLESDGHMELDGKLSDVQLVTSVIIRSSTRHCDVLRTTPSKIHIIVFPLIDRNDGCFD